MSLRREGLRAESHADFLRGTVAALDETSGEGRAEGCRAPLNPWRPVERRRRNGRLVVRWLKVPNLCRCPACRVQRAALRASVEATALFKAADENERCGRERIYCECRDYPGEPGHGQWVLRRCGLGLVCPECARIEAARLLRLYGPRVDAVRRAWPELVPKMVTLSLAPREVETLGEAYERCRVAGLRVLRVLWGWPLGRKDWALYWQLYPLTPGQVSSAAGKTEAARRRNARAARRRALLHRLERGRAGWLAASEFGEQGMKAHLHALVIGRYVPQHVISQAWRLATEGSRIVDVRAAWSVREVVKYAVKFTGRSPEELAKVYRALCGRRRIEAAGCLRAQRWPVHFPPVCSPAPAPPLRCSACGAEVVPVGIVSAELWNMGVTIPPKDRLFRAAQGAPARAGPGP